MAFTFFFRDQHTLQQIVDELVPRVMGRSKIKVWDAGCASGQEPYTFAILLREKMGKHIFRNVKIYATDIDISNQFGKIIEDGIYPYQELQRIPKELFEKYFHEYSTDAFQIDTDLRNKMTYKRESLLSLQPVSHDLSLIICKNVLLHQQADERVAIIKMFHQSLAPQGLLVMEQTQKMPEETAHLFKQVVSHAQIFEKIETHS